MKRFNITVNGKAYDVAVEEITDGSPGEICVNGYSLMHGYMAEPEKTKSTY